MFELVCVTNRALCGDDFAARLAALAAAGVDKIILREKDLPEGEYIALARQALAAAGDRLVLHSFPAACVALGAPRLHVPLHQLEAQPGLRGAVGLLGVSVHAPEEAVRAVSLGADYVTAGHVFATGCKRGLPGRGLDFLRATVQAAAIPVYAIGGIAADNLSAVRETGAAGACLMSGFMRCEDVKAEVERLRSVPI
ncbi:MAG: thiamine phosphate synthase [Butyricicoccus pullicaecorum]|nr:thiamine phosphate synthase [Butyricicoccus pullicaecorum]